ncbi:MAG: hypothetical protein WCX88_04380 [Patescibacteria group bacterium]
MENFELKEDIPIEKLKRSLSQIMNEIFNYNNSFSYGMMLGKAMAGSLSSRLEISDEDPEKHPGIEYKKIEEKYSLALQNLGLEIESSKKEVVAFPQTKPENSVKISINFDNSKNFSNFICRLEQSNITDQEIENLKDVIDSVMSQLINNYDLNSADDRLLNLFSNIKDIIKNYKRLDSDKQNGLAEKASELEKILALADKKILREYILAKNNGILPEQRDGGYGPYNFHIDPGGFTNRWDKIIKSLEQIKQNPDANDFYQKILKYLENCISDSEIYFKNNTEKQNKTLNFTSYLKQAEEIKNRLSQI